MPYFSLAMGWHEVLRELEASLADAWKYADLRGRLASWWEVVTGAAKVD